MPEQYTDEQSRGYYNKEAAKVAAEGAATVAAISEAGATARAGLDLLKEFIKVGVSNPIVGAASAMILADILQRSKIISSNTEAVVFGVGLAAIGVQLGGEVANDVSSLIDAINPVDLFKQPSSPPSPLQPSAQVVVFGDSAGEKVARALSGQLLPEVRYIEGKGA